MVNVSQFRGDASINYSSSRDSTQCLYTMTCLYRKIFQLGFKKIRIVGSQSVRKPRDTIVKFSYSACYRPYFDGLSTLILMHSVHIVLIYKLSQKKKTKFRADFQTLEDLHTVSNNLYFWRFLAIHSYSSDLCWKWNPSHRVFMNASHFFASFGAKITHMFSFFAPLLTLYSAMMTHDCPSPRH